MRFTPLTFMGVEDCFLLEANGGVSGSFTSGSETYNYHEFTTSVRLNDQSFSVDVVKGFSSRVRVIAVGGGGGGGQRAPGGSAGGAGGGGGVTINNEVFLYKRDQSYVVQVGGAGEGADAGATLPSYNGENGDASRFYFGDGSELNVQANGGEGGNGGVSPANSDGGDSGNGFTGGADNGENIGGGGAGSTANGGNAVNNDGGDGGAGTTIVLPYTSPTLGASTIKVGGGGGGGVFSVGQRGVGATLFGGGSGADSAQDSDSGTRFTGGGAGGGDAFGPDAGSEGGDGLVIIMYPTGSCPPTP